MPVLVSMRFRVLDFGGLEQTAAEHAEIIKESGCNWYKICQRDRDPHEVLWLMEFNSHEAFERSSSDLGKAFIDLIDPLGEWDDAIWEVSFQG